MNKASSLRKLILGNTPFILSHADFKRALLTGQLSLLTFFVCVGYIFFDLLNNVNFSWPFQISCALAALLSFVLNRNRRFLSAKIILGIAVNFTVFIFSSSEPYETGLHTYFIVTSIGALASFGYEERKLASLFVILSVTLCMISVFSDFHVLPLTEKWNSYIKTNLIINILTASLSSALIILFLLTVNHKAEQSLKESEQLLIRKNDELIKLNKELDQFVYSTSHDLRAPLSSVLGLLQLADVSTDAQELREYHQMMKTRVHDLEKFIVDISDYARNARLTIDKEPVLIHRVFREVLEQLRYFPGSEKIMVQLNVPDDLSIQTDLIRFKIVLANLLSNCFKYSDFTKPQSNVIISSLHTPGNFCLMIEDNGIGIPAENLPRIFDMFYQAHERSKGSGLGLFIVKETLQKLGGTITVQSEAGKGTRFEIQLTI